MDDVQCVVFDIDDTLYLERDYVRSGFRAVGHWAAEQLGIPDFYERAWQAFLQGERQTIFNRVLAETGHEAKPDLITRMISVYRRHVPEITLLDDARKCLDALKGHRRMAVVTDGPLESQQAKAARLGLAGWIDPILFTAGLGPDFGKPDPRSFQRVESETRYSGPQCIYVADNPHKDFQGPASLGWHCLRIRRPEGLHHDVPLDSGDHDPENIGELDTLEQLPAWLGLKPSPGDP
jgi:putative hydrolase of the HAD superfamily